MNHDKAGSQYTDGKDEKPGTADDALIHQDENGVGYIDENGTRRYPAKDEVYYTEDDRFKTPEEVQTEVNHDSDGNRYTDGADKIPGTDDDVQIKDDGDGKKASTFRELVKRPEASIIQA